MNIDHLIVFNNLANLLFNSIFPLIPSSFSLSHTHTLSHSLSHSPSHSPSLSLTFSHSLYPSLSLSLSYTDSLYHIHTLTHTLFPHLHRKSKFFFFSFLLSYKFIENSPVFPHNHGSLSLERISEKSEKHFFSPTSHSIPPRGNSLLTIDEKKPLRHRH